MPSSDSGSLFLNSEKRKPVKVSPIAEKAKAKAPPNLAIYDGDELNEVVQQVVKLAQNAYGVYMNQRAALEDRWSKADSFYWMDSKKQFKNSEMTRAKVAAASFNRVCRRLADGAQIATFQDEMPVKFFPEIDPFDPSDDKTNKAAVAQALNNWGKYCMRKTDLAGKSKDAYYKTYKYSTFIAYVPYDYEIEKKTRWEAYSPNAQMQAADGKTVYKHVETGEVSDAPHPPELKAVEYDFVSKNNVGFYPLPIESCWLDDRILDLNRQSAFGWRSDITRAELWSLAMAGVFQNIEKISEAQAFQVQSSNNAPENERRMESGKTTADSTASEMYERWGWWMLIPKIKVTMGKNGKPTKLEWDQNAAPRRYRLEIVGDMNGSIVVTRFSESDYWSNNIPFIAAHSHADDGGFYGRGLVELLEDNMEQEQIAKGQLMDNRTLRTFRPAIRLKGRVMNKDMRVMHNTVFDVTSPDALKFMEIPDISQTIGATLSLLQEESKELGQTPGFMMGEGTGSRTSATEFSAIRDQSSAPAMNDIKTLNMMISGGFMMKVKEYAPQFLERDIAVKLGGPNSEDAVLMVTSDEFDADLLLQDVSVQDFENKSTMRQILLNLVGVVSNPVFAPFLNVAGFLSAVFRTFKSVFPNPEEIINKEGQVNQVLQAYLQQKSAAEGPPQAMLGNMGAPGGGPPPPAAGGPMGEGQTMAGIAGQAGGM